MNPPPPPARETSEERSRFDRAVDYLWSNTGAPRELIHEFLIEEIARLGGTAAITKYIYVLAASNVRTRLRSSILSAAHRQLSAPAA